MSNYLSRPRPAGDHIALRAERSAPDRATGGRRAACQRSLAMAQSLDRVAHPVYLLYGVERTEDLCKLDELTEHRRGPAEVHVVAPTGLGQARSPTCSTSEMLATCCLCGQNAMVDTGEPGWTTMAGLYYEKFVASEGGAPPPPLGWITRAWTLPGTPPRPQWSSAAASRASRRRKMLQRDLRSRHRAGGDGPHRRRGRARQGWHLHHLRRRADRGDLLDDARGVPRSTWPPAAVSSWAAPGKARH